MNLVKLLTIMNFVNDFTRCTSSCSSEFLTRKSFVSLIKKSIFVALKSSASNN